MTSRKDGYITVGISEFYKDLIDKCLKLNREDAKFSGRNPSGADVVRLALDELFKKRALEEFKSEIARIGLQSQVASDLTKYSKNIQSTERRSRAELRR